MAARRKVGRKGRKPPLHIVSDFGSRNSHSITRKIGKDKKLRSKGNFGAK